MKKVFGAALLAVMLFATVGVAEVIEFPSLKGTIDVAPGWAYEDDAQGTVLLTAGDKSTAVSITRAASEGFSAKELAEQLAGSIGGGAPKDGGNGAWVTVAGTTMAIVTLSPDGKEAVVITISGNVQNPDVDKMLSSMKDK